MTEFACSAFAQENPSVAASTTARDSGLFGYLPALEGKTGLDAKLLAQGRGRALDRARPGDADIGVRARRGSQGQFMTEGFGVKRFWCYERYPDRASGRSRRPGGAADIVAVAIGD